MTLAESEALQRRKAAERPASRFVSAQWRRGSCKRFPMRCEGNELIAADGAPPHRAQRRQADDHACSSFRTACLPGWASPATTQNVRRHAAARHDAVGRRPQSLRGLCLCA